MARFDMTNSDGVAVAMGWVCSLCGKKFLIGWRRECDGLELCHNCAAKLFEDKDICKFIVW